LVPHVDDEYADKPMLIEDFPQYFKKNEIIKVLDLSMNKCSIPCLKKLAENLSNKPKI